MGILCCANRKERKKIVLLLLGLDNAGKTVAVKSLAGEPLDTVVPTVGFSVVALRHMRYDVNVYDLGGRTDFRDIWERYYVDAHGIIFVVDASDYERLSEANEVLTNIISHDKIRGKPLLILCNKQDNENALDEIDLVEKFELEATVNDYECPTLVESCSASEDSKLDPGIRKGYNWIVSYVIQHYGGLNERVAVDTKHQEEADKKEREAKIRRLKMLSERDENEKIAAEQPKTNGFTLSDVYIIRNNRNKHSDSDSSESIDSLPRVYYGTIQQEVLPNEQRPKSATKMVRQQLELKNLQTKRNSFKFASNKTAPAQLYGIRRQLSAGERKTTNETVMPDRRNLKSAGDSIFVVSSSKKLSLPANDGSGDLRPFGPGTARNNALPPIEIVGARLPNGVHESNFDNHI